MSSPKVWTRFTTTKSDGTVLKLRLEEVTEARWTEILDFLRKHFIGSEPFQKASGIYKNEDAIQEYMKIYTDALRDPKLHVVICCQDSIGVSSIIGASVMCLESKDGEDRLENILTMLQTPEVKKLFEILQFLGKRFEEKKVPGLERYYSGRTIVVDPEYRKLGIANEFVKLRTEICKEHGVPATGAWMTAVGTQKSAENNNWKTVYEISFEELGKAVGVNFEGAPLMCKKMVARI